MPAEASAVCLACTTFLKDGEKDIHRRTTFHQKNIQTHGDQNEYFREKSFIIDLSKNLDVIYNCVLCKESFGSYSAALQHLTYHELRSGELKCEREWAHNIRIVCNFGFDDANFSQNCTEQKSRGIKESQVIPSTSADTSWVQYNYSIGVNTPLQSTTINTGVQDVSSDLTNALMSSAVVTKSPDKCGLACRNQKSVVKGKSQVKSIECDICLISCLGQESYNAHIAGKKHKKKVEAKNKPQPRQPVSAKSKKDPPQTYYCTICKVSLPNINNYDQHCNSNKHLSKVAATISKPSPYPLPEDRTEGLTYGDYSRPAVVYPSNDIRYQSQTVNTTPLPASSFDYQQYYGYSMNNTYPRMGTYDRQARSAYSYRY